MDSYITAKYIDRTGNEQRCIIRAFLPTNRGIKAVVEKADTHCLYEMNVEQLTVTRGLLSWDVKNDSN